MFIKRSAHNVSGTQWTLTVAKSYCDKPKTPNRTENLPPWDFSVQNDLNEKYKRE